MKLRKYQSEGRKEIASFFTETNLKLDNGFLLLDDVGLGKSVQALLGMDDACRILIKKGANMPKHHIVICPAYLKLNWEEEILKWLPREKRSYEYSILIKSYNDLTKPGMLHYLTKYRHGFLIIDELHYLISLGSLRTQAIFGNPEFRHTPLLNKCLGVIGLSATFPPDRVGDLYPWLWATKRLIRNSSKYTYYNFIKTFAAKIKKTPIRDHYKIPHTGIKNVPELKKLLGKGFLRRTKRQVQDQLPSIIPNTILVENTPELIQDENEILKEVFGYVPTNPKKYVELFLQVEPSLEKMSAYRKKIGILKTSSIILEAQELLKSGVKKFIIACHHIDVVEIIAETLEKTVEVIRITGGVTLEKRHELIATTKNKKEVVLVGTVPSFGEGLNMVDFDRLLIGEYNWSPKTNTQAIGRIDRLTQLAKYIYVTDFLIRGGLEYKIYKTQQRKQEDINKIFA